LNHDGRMIEVGHLIAACDGDPEKLAGLAVLLSFASVALVQAHGGLPIRPQPGDRLRATADEQLKLWASATEEIQKQLWRARSH
jgi:hypothetical protein